MEELQAIVSPTEPSVNYAIELSSPFCITMLYIIAYILLIVEKKILMKINYSIQPRVQ